MDIDHGIELILGLLNGTVAAIILLRGRSSGRMAIPLMVLASFFTIRAFARMSAAFDVDDSSVVSVGVGQALDVLLVAALVGILVTIERVMRGVAAVEDAARYRKEEYERANRHYTQVVRHRMMNPIAAIRGAALTLRDRPEITDPTRGQLLDAIIDGCGELEQVSLVPERRDELERDLDAVPRIDHERRRTEYPNGPVAPR